MHTRLTLDSSIYSIEPVQKAAYRFIDRLIILLSVEEGSTVCDIDPAHDLKESYEQVIGSFKQELIDQQLRFQIKRETAPVRNLILSYAFSRSGLQQ